MLRRQGDLGPAALPDQPARTVAQLPGHQRVRQHERVGKRALRRAAGPPAIATAFLEECRPAARGAGPHRADPGGHRTRRRAVVFPPAAHLRRAARWRSASPPPAAPSVILLDEPTAGMSHAETERAVELDPPPHRGPDPGDRRARHRAWCSASPTASRCWFTARSSPRARRMRSATIPRSRKPISARRAALMLEVRDLSRLLRQEPYPAGRRHAHRRRRSGQPARTQRRRTLHHREGDQGRSAAAPRAIRLRARASPACRATASPASARPCPRKPGHLPHRCTVR